MEEALMPDESQEIVIVSAARTPVGKFQGALSGFTATELGAIAVREAVHRAGLDPKHVDECLMGCVLPAGLGQNPARSVIPPNAHLRALILNVTGHAAECFHTDDRASSRLGVRK